MRRNIPAAKMYDWLSEILAPSGIKEKDKVDLSKFTNIEDPILYKKGIGIKVRSIPKILKKQTDFYDDYRFYMESSGEKLNKMRNKKIGSVKVIKYTKLGNFMFSVEGRVLQKLFPEKDLDEIDGVFVKTHLINYKDGIYSFGFVEIIIHSRLNLLREHFNHNGTFYPVCYNFSQLYDVKITKNDIRSLNFIEKLPNGGEITHEARTYFKYDKTQGDKKLPKYYLIDEKTIMKNIRFRNKYIERNSFDSGDLEVSVSEIEKKIGARTNPEKQKYERVKVDDYVQNNDIYTVAFMENLDGDVKNLFGKEVTIPNEKGVDKCKAFVKTQKEIIIQLLYALYCANEWFEFEHRDCHTGNVMYKLLNGTVNIVIPKEELFFKFDTKYFVKIIDFGFSKTNLPDEQTQNDDFDRELIGKSLEKFGKDNKEYTFRGFLQDYSKGILLSDLSKFFTTSMNFSSNKPGYRTRKIRKMYENWHFVYSEELKEYTKGLKEFLVELFKDTYDYNKKKLTELHKNLIVVIKTQKIKNFKAKMKMVVEVCEKSELKYQVFVRNLVQRINTGLKNGNKNYNEILKPVMADIDNQQKLFKLKIEDHLERVARGYSTTMVGFELESFVAKKSKKSLKSVRKNFGLRRKRLADEALKYVSDKSNDKFDKLMILRAQQFKDGFAKDPSMMVLKSLRVGPAKYLELMKTSKFFDDIRKKVPDQKIDENDYTFVYQDNPKYNQNRLFMRNLEEEENEGIEDMFMQIKKNKI